MSLSASASQISDSMIVSSEVLRACLIRTRSNILHTSLPSEARNDGSSEVAEQTNSNNSGASDYDENSAINNVMPAVIKSVYIC